MSRVRSPPVPVVLSVHQRGSLLDGLAMYLSCDTKKFHDNESTHILHNFGRPPIGGKLPHFPPGGVTELKCRYMADSPSRRLESAVVGHDCDGLAELRDCASTALSDRRPCPGK